MHAQSILGKTTTYLALPAINASYPLFPLFVMLYSLTEGTTTQILANDSLRKLNKPPSNTSGRIDSYVSEDVS